MNHNKNFTVQELAEDSSFQRMVKGNATPEEVEEWNSWIEASDQNRRKAKTAIADIVGFEFDDPVLPDIKDEWSRLFAKTAGKQGKKTPHYYRNSNENKLKWFFRVAAVLLILSLAGLGTYHFYEDESITQLEQVTEEKTITTEEGEQKTLLFSNGSKIVLNSSSSLSYRIGLLHNQTIEITLEGEAWFDADSDSEQAQPIFAVTTPDGVIRDIGTKFLVTIENGHSRIVLQEGLVEVQPHETNRAKTQSGQKFHVLKGEMVEFRRANILKRKKINPTFFTSWATGYMELDQTGIHEFADYVEKRFGVKVEIRDSQLIDIKLDGAVHFRSLDELVRSVSEVIGIPVYRSSESDAIYIGNSSNR